MLILFYILSFSLLTISAVNLHSSNSPLTINLELSRDIKKTLGFPEDAYLNFTELATKYGYPSEEHTAVTKDGYIVKLFRISSKRNEPLGPPILMVYGLADSPEVWIHPGPGRGLGYVLADAGFDVWCADYRGSTHTRSHATLDPNKDAEFWNYSVDQISQFDMPVLINYVLEIRNVPSLAFVGHSMGCRLFYQIEAYRPDIYNKVNVMISLAPSAWETHSFNPGFRTASKFIPQLDRILKTLNAYELLGSHSLVGNFIFKMLCARANQDNRSVNEELCSFILSSNFGPDPEQLRPELIPVIFGHNLNTISTQIVAQMGQGFHTRNFQRYDRGLKGNLEVYGRPTPPQYNVSMVTTPIAIFSGNNDWLVSSKDVETLKSKLPNLIEHYVVPRPSWNHIDFLYGKENPELVGKRIIKIIGNYSVNNS